MLPGILGMVFLGNLFLVSVDLSMGRLILGLVLVVFVMYRFAKLTREYWKEPNVSCR